MRKALVALGAVAGLALCAVVLAPPVAAEPSAEPTATVDKPQITAPDTLTVTGAGWPPQSQVKAEFCGNGAAQGSADCDQFTSQTFFAGASGEFRLRLEVPRAPTSCPCLVQLTLKEPYGVVRVPVEVDGVPVRPPVAALAIDVAVVDATVTDGEERWTAWFGASAPKVLDVTYENRGATVIAQPVLRAYWGEDGDHVITTPPLPPLAVGERASVRVPFELEALTIGEVDVGGVLRVGGQEMPYTTSTSQRPWGWLLVLVIPIQMVLVKSRNRVRAHHLRALTDEAAQKADPNPPPARHLRGGTDAAAQKAEPSEQELGMEPLTPRTSSAVEVIDELTMHYAGVTRGGR